MILFYASWFSSEDDARMQSWRKAVIESTETAAKDQGLLHSFRFLNDAAPFQKPFETYGYGQNLQKMKDVSEKYDPKGAFQTLVPGFKLSDASFGDPMME